MDANVKMHHDRDTGESHPSKSLRTCVEPGGEEHESVRPIVVHDLRAVNFETCTADPYSLSQDVTCFYAQVPDGSAEELAEYLANNGGLAKRQTKLTDYYEP